MRPLRNLLADVLEEAARGRRAGLRSSAALGRILKHLGVARAFETVANVLRVDSEGDE